MSSLGDRLPVAGLAAPSGAVKGTFGSAPTGLPWIWRLGEGPRHQFRSLVPGILQRPPDARVIGLCSTLPGEGTTTVTSGLACAIAEAHVKVAVLDTRGGQAGHTADVWNPSPAESSDIAGSIAIIDGQAGVDPVGNVRRLIADIRPRFGVVLVDMMPLKDGPQTIGLAGALDTIYLVVEADRERREVIAQSVRTLQRGGLHIAGVLLNKRVRVIPDVLYRWL